MVNKYSIFVAIVAVLVFFNACKDAPQLNLEDKSLIPIPLSVEPTFESFEISSRTKVCFNLDNTEIEKVASHLTSILQSTTGFEIQYATIPKLFKGGKFFIELKEDSSFGNEGYQINISPKNVMISAYKPTGLFYAVQTLRQLLPLNIEADSLQQIKYFIPTGIIRDLPKYQHRGVMLDVARHFFHVNDVKHFIDFLAYYKMNVLHLHLANDQGWRIEIKSWPKLTEIGGSTQVGGGKGGFYTQDQYKEIVAYAQERFITIIPEIDMPGHTNAALASYGQLNCNNVSTKPYTGMRVGFSSLCIHKAITYQFIDDVIREISALTPSRYFHIGGDESHSTSHNDFVYFIDSAISIVKKHGKTPVGWDEISHADINKNTLVQYWWNKENAQRAIHKGARVIMSPANFAYLDMKYDSESVLGLTWAGFIEVDKAYNWSPDTMIRNINVKQIVGIECPLWSETVCNIDEIEYLLFPRLPGYAEIGWSQDSLRNWDNYKQRLARHGKWFEAMEIDYYKSPVVDW